MRFRARVIADVRCQMNRRRVCIVFVVAFFVVGVIIGHLLIRGQYEGPVRALPNLLLSIFAFAWCRADAAARDKKVPWYTAALTILLAPFGFLLYAFMSYPWRQAVALSIKAVGLLLISFASLACGVWVSRYAGI